MKSELLRQFRKLFQEKKVGFDKKLLIFLFFLALSSFIWLLNVLDKEYITELEFPVKYENFPAKLVQTKTLPESFTLRVEASGYLLLKHKIGKTINPLHIDILEFLSEQIINDTVGFNIRTTNFRDEIENQLHKQIKVIDIKPEIIDFLFEKEVTREVEIYADLNYTLDKQLILKTNPKIEPQKVFVSGPKNMIDTISRVYSITKDLGLITDDINTTIKLKPIKNLVYSYNEASLYIKVEKYTESTFQIPIFINNLPDSISLQLNPDKVTISYCIGLSNYKNIKPSQFSLTVDFNEYVESKTSKLTVLIKNTPESVFNIKINPRTVNYIIKNKN